MKKYLCLIGLLSLITNFSFSQNPYNGIPYQAVMRNSNGVAIADSTINLLFQLRSGSTQGTLIYEETQTISTNGHGLMSAYIGNGQASLGTFENIDWKSYPLFLKVLMNGAEMGSQELKSVPYAIQSKYAEKVRVDLSPNGDTLLVGDTLIAVSQFNTGLNGTGELINDHSGMVQTTTLNLNCVVDELPFLRIKACDMDTAENMYFLLEYQGEHDFYGMHLSCNATTAYKLCKVNANGIVIWSKSILCPSGITQAYLASSTNGRILLSANSSGTSNGISAYPFQVQLSEITLNYINRAQFMILFDENGNYLDHENIPGNYLIKFFSSNNQGYAAINENADATTTAIVAMRMYQYSGNTIDLLWSNTTASWGSCLSLKMDRQEPTLHCIFIGGNQYNTYSYRKFNNNTQQITQNLVQIQAITPFIPCEFLIEENNIYLSLLGNNIAIYNNSIANTTADMPTLKISLETGQYQIMNSPNSSSNDFHFGFTGSNSSLNNAMIATQYEYFPNSAEFFNRVYLQLLFNSNFHYLNIHQSDHHPYGFSASLFMGSFLINNKFYLIGNYYANSSELGLMDCQFPQISGKSEFPFVLKTNLTP